METVVLLLPGEHWIGLHRKSLSAGGGGWVSSLIRANSDFYNMVERTLYYNLDEILLDF